MPDLQPEIVSYFDWLFNPVPARKPVQGPVGFPYLDLFTESSNEGGTDSSSDSSSDSTSESETSEDEVPDAAIQGNVANAQGGAANVGVGAASGSASSPATVTSDSAPGPVTLSELLGERPVTAPARLPVIPECEDVVMEEVAAVPQVKDGFSVVGGTDADLDAAIDQAIADIKEEDLRVRGKVVSGESVPMDRCAPQPPALPAIPAVLVALLHQHPDLAVWGDEAFVGTLSGGAFIGKAGPFDPRLFKDAMDQIPDFSSLLPNIVRRWGPRIVAPVLAEGGGVLGSPPL